jgi:hypothetical protein
VADVRLPPTLPPLSPGLPRRLERASRPVCGDRLCEPGPVIRRHIHVFVDGERAELDSAVPARSRVDVITATSGG